MGNEVSQQVQVAVAKDVNMDDFTDEYRCCKEEYRLSTSSTYHKKTTKKEKAECNDKLVIPANASTNRIVKDKLEYYLNDIRQNISDQKAK